MLIVQEDIKSMGGLIGGEAKKLTNFRNSSAKTVCGELMNKAMAAAMGTTSNFFNCSIKLGSNTSSVSIVKNVYSDLFGLLVDIVAIFLIQMMLE